MEAASEPSPRKLSLSIPSPCLWYPAQGLLARTGAWRGARAFFYQGSDLDLRVLGDRL